MESWQGYRYTVSICDMSRWRTTACALCMMYVDVGGSTKTVRPMHKVYLQSCLMVTSASSMTVLILSKIRTILMRQKIMATILEDQVPRGAGRLRFAPSCRRECYAPLAGRARGGSCETFH